MTLQELLPQLKELSYKEKFEAIEFLRKDLGIPGMDDFFSSPVTVDSNAAQILEDLLKEHAQAKI